MFHVVLSALENRFHSFKYQFSRVLRMVGKLWKSFYIKVYPEAWRMQNILFRSVYRISFMKLLFCIQFQPPKKGPLDDEFVNPVDASSLFSSYKYYIFLKAFYRKIRSVRTGRLQFEIYSFLISESYNYQYLNLETSMVLVSGSV